LGFVAVLVLGAAVAGALLVLQRPASEPARADAGASSGLRPPADASPAPSTLGSRTRVVLKVRSKPSGASIRYCGRDTGLTTPARLRTKAGRRCVLELKLAGHHPYRRKLTAPSRDRLIVATLRARRPRAAAPAADGTGLLRITSIQVGTVYVNRRAVGRTPKLELRLAPGVYSVQVHFRTLAVRTPTRRVSVHAGRTAVAHFDPQP
jgi:hypothetical protein